MKKFTSIIVALAALALASSCCMTGKKCDRSKKHAEKSEKSEVKAEAPKAEVKAEAPKAEKKAKKAKKVKAEKKAEVEAPKAQ